MSHNNGTGKYSWWNGVMVLPSWFELDGADIYNAAVYIVIDKVSDELEYTPSPSFVEIESLNKI